MLTSPDFKELLNLFKKYKVKYLIIGGYAVMRYTESRLILTDSVYNKINMLHVGWVGTQWKPTIKLK